MDGLGAILDMASQSQESGGGEGPSQTQGDGNTERVWKLRDCSMTLGAFGKRNSTDPYMTLDLVFTFPDDVVPKIVGEFV